VQYSRPFVTGVRHRLGEAALSIFTPEQRANHDYFRAVRDKHVAHSVNAFEESQPVARYWVERVAEEGIEQISCIHNRIVGLSDNDLAELIDLAKTMSAYVDKQVADERAKVLAIVRQMPLEQVLKGRPFSPPTATDPSKRRRH
jgi:hypothetical protein